MSQAPKRKFSVRSLWCATFLVVMKHRLIGFELVSADNGCFSFVHDGSIQRDTDAFYSDNPPVPIREFRDAYNGLRDLLMQKRKTFGST